MAMIECPECGRKISSFAPTCPGCGVPQDVIKKMRAEQENKKENDMVQTATIETTVSQTGIVQTAEAETVAIQTVTVQTKSVKTDVVMKQISTAKNAVEKNVIETHLAENKMVNCAVCKNSYSMEEGVCPKCKNPLLSVSKDSTTLKQLVKDYRKEVGIQLETSLSINTQDMKVRQHLETGHYQGDATIVNAVVEPKKNEVIPVATISKAGEYYKMGHYGGEEILWRVLKVEDEKALLISEKGLDTIPYNNLYGDITWERCTLRSWLNTVFLNTAFSKKEKCRILRMYIAADQNPIHVPIEFLEANNPTIMNDPIKFFEKSNPVYGAAAGNGTQDQIFLLSIQESEKYFANDEDRKAYPTAYAEKNSAFVAAGTKCCLWWLRSPGSRSVDAAYVSGTGTNQLWGINVDDHDICIRPALWINL